jgi:DNA-directed RNA polymerase subunit RPC12/RpoP
MALHRCSVCRRAWVDDKEALPSDLCPNCPHRMVTKAEAQQNDLEAAKLEARMVSEAHESYLADKAGCERAARAAEAIMSWGWICPRCHVVHAPSVLRCECSDVKAQQEARWDYAGGNPAVPYSVPPGKTSMP